MVRPDLPPTGPGEDPARIHVPVMAGRVVEMLSDALHHEGAVYVDGTLGMAGHASLVLEANPRAQLVGIDQDGDALALAATRLHRFGDRVHLVRARFDELPEVLDGLGVHGLDAMLLDLGLSSLQIDHGERARWLGQAGTDLDPHAAPRPGRGPGANAGGRREPR